MMKRIIRTITFLYTWSPSICGAVLVTAAILHKMQLDSSSYTSSPLIDFEMIPLIIIILLIITHTIMLIFRCVKREWSQVIFIVINIIISIVSVIAAMIIDAPTLIYMS